MSLKTIGMARLMSRADKASKPIRAASKANFPMLSAAAHSAMNSRNRSMKDIVAMRRRPIK
jgi:hypothetical protein